MHYKFVFDPNSDEMTADDFDTLALVKRGEKDEVDALRVHELMSKFLVDENNQPVSSEQAFKVIGKMKKQTYIQAQKDFMEAVSIAAIPLPREVKSTLPSGQESETSPSLAGSQP